jgi:hypothetical protein
MDYQEGPMKRRARSRHSLHPGLEQVEPRMLLSAITDIMLGNRKVALASLAARQKQAYATPNVANVSTSGTSIATPENQGAQGLNLVITPIGTLTPAEKRRERFLAKFVGIYSVQGGRFDSEAAQVMIQAAGTASSMLHSDIQMRLVVAKDPSIPNSGLATIYDRNLNTNTALGFDLTTTTPHFDKGGRPNRFDVVTIDPNISSGTYTQGFSQGVITIRYAPNGARTRGVLSQGKVYVTVQAQIYASNVSSILRNASLNP